MGALAAAGADLAAAARRGGGNLNWKRIFCHLLYLPLSARRAFPPQALDAIEEAIRACEETHQGEIRFAVEGSLGLMPLLRGQSARQRALEIFSALRVWDTEHNNGVLVYLLLADRDVEIIADRGVHRLVGDAAWEAVCRDMECAFRAGHFEAGVVSGIQAIGRQLTVSYPASAVRPNELPDPPVVL